ncbi:MAG: solute carrier family 26 protein [Bacteroidota bacterium]
MKQTPLIPVKLWLPNYRWKLLPGDLLAGLTVAIMLVPQGMAYAMLAGLPPIYGLYAGLVPLFIYPFLGTSPRLSVGPVALVSILVLAGLNELAAPGSQAFIDLAILTGLLAGMIQLLLGVLRMGFLVKFLSHAVLSGFTSAAALIISVSQLKYLFGIEVAGGQTFIDYLVGLAVGISNFHWLSFGVGTIAFAILFFFKRWKPRWPVAIVVLAAGTFFTEYFHWNQQDLDIVGAVPSGLPMFQLPVWSVEMVQQVLPLSLAICLISFIESLAIAKVLESKAPEFRVVPNQELLALGISKLAGAFFLSYPTTGSFSRSAVNSEAGANSPISSLVSSIIIGLILLFFTPLFYHMPKAILASIVLSSVLGLINWKEAKLYWKTSKRDFATLIATFIATLLAGIQVGITIGVILSLIFVIYRSAQPHFPVLGRIPESNRFRNVNRFEDVEMVRGMLILRFDAPLYFTNADYFEDRIETLVEETNRELQAVILDTAPIYDIDNSGLTALESIYSFLKSKQIRFILTGATGPLRDKLYRANLTDLIGKHNQFLAIQDAIAFLETKDAGWSDRALQTDLKPKK